MNGFKKTILNKYVIIPMLLSLLALSYVSIPHITIKKNPSVKFSVIRIYGKIPHFNKDQIANTVVSPLINQLRHDSGIKKSNIEVSDGKLYIALDYFFNVNSEDRMWELKTIMTRLKASAKLPPKTEFKYYQKDIETRIKPFIIGIIWPNEQKISMSKLNEIKNQFQQLKGVKSVVIENELESCVVRLDPDKMIKNQIRLIEVINALKAVGVIQENKVTDHDGIPIVLSQKKSTYTADNLHLLPIKTQLNQQFRLQDIAIVAREYSNTRGQVTINGQASHLMGLTLYANASITNINKKVLELIHKINHHPDMPRIDMIHNQADEVQTFIREFKWNILIGAFLIFISLLLLTTVKMGVLTAIMLPLTSLFSLSLMTISGIQLQQVSLAGFIIALGLIVDNAIILQEVVDMQPKNESRLVNIYRSVKQVFPSIAVSTLTTLMAFAPVFLLKSEEGVFLRSLPVSIWFNLIVAFFLSMTLLPFLLYQWPKKWKLKLPSISTLFHGTVQHKYMQLLQQCFKHPWLILIVIISAIFVIMSILTTIKVDVMPSKSNLMFYLNLSNPNQSSNIARLQVSQLESFIQSDPGVFRVVSAIGQSIPRLDLSFQQISGNPGDAQILIYTKSEADKKRLINQVKELIPNLPYSPQTLLASLIYSEVYKYPIKVKLVGTNHNVLLNESEKIKRSLSQWNTVDYARIDGIKEVSQLSFQINQTLQKQHGIIGQELDAWLQLLLSPISVGLVTHQEELMAVNLKVNTMDEFYNTLNNVGILNQYSQKIPLITLLENEFKQQSPSIIIEDFLATVTILVKPHQNTEIEELQKNINRFLNQYDYPQGIQFDIAGKLDKQNEVLGEFAIYSLIVVFLMYAILVIRFRSFKQPLLIYLTIPLSFVGSLVCIYLSGQPLTFVGLLGLTGLTGIVINDGILLVDTANSYSANGYSANEAIKKAASERFFPVVLTSITTVIGLIPLLISTNMFSQLALAFLTGLVSSTVLLLFILPVLYQRLNKKHEINTEVYRL